MNIVLIIGTQRTAGRIAVMETVQLNLSLIGTNVSITDVKRPFVIVLILDTGRIPQAVGIGNARRTVFLSDGALVDGKTGVYTLDGNVVRFKETKVLYEDEGMYICEMPMLDGRPTVLKKQLSLYDAVVVSGRDLYEGKILN